MRSFGALLFSLGCGAGTGGPTDGAVTVPPPPSAAQDPNPAAEAGIEARLGCKVITREQVDSELASAKRRSDKPITRDAIRERLVRAVVVAKLAAEHEVGVDAEEIDAGIAAVAKEYKMTSDELMASVQEHGVDRATYRAEVKAELLEMKLRMRLAEGDFKAVLDKSEVELERVTKELAASRCADKPVP